MAAAPARQVLERTRAAVEYQRDPERPGRPIGLMLAGTAVAMLAAVLCARLAYQIWYAHIVDPDYGIYGISLLFAFFVLGAYLFSYGFELYDGQKALRLTIVLAISGVIALAVMIAVLVALAYVVTGAGITLTERQQSMAINVATMAVDGNGADPDGGKHAEPVPGLPLISCEHCGRDFIAVPPAAICPWCDTPYFSIAQTKQTA
jgi:hypothetical protein